MKKKFNLLLKQILCLFVISYFSLAWGVQTPISVFHKQIQPYSESKIKDIQGTLEIRSEVSLKSSRDFIQYFLKTDQGTYYHIDFMDGIPLHLKTGDKIKIKNSYLRAVNNTYRLFVSKNDLLVLMPATTKLPDGFGPQPTIVFLVNFQDDQAQPFTIDQVRTAIFTNVSNQFNEFSYQQTTLTGIVVGWYTIPISHKSTCATITYDLPTLAQNAAVAAGVEVYPYTRQIYLFPHTDSCDWKGVATIGWQGHSYSQAWLNGDINISLIAHLLGHNIGLFHSNSLECQGTVNTGTCNQVEQGDTADTMGFLNGAHFNALQKEIIGWLNYNSFPLIKTVTTSGTYLIAPFETMGNNIKAIKVLKRAGTNDYYYLEYRQPIGYDSVLNCSNCNFTKGVLVHQGNPSYRDSSEMLNMSPISNSNTLVTLLPGQSFFDPYAPKEGVIFTVNWVGSAGASVTITFRSG